MFDAKLLTPLSFMILAVSACDPGSLEDALAEDQAEVLSDEAVSAGAGEDGDLDLAVVVPDDASEPLTDDAYSQNHCGSTDFHGPVECRYHKSGLVSIASGVTANVSAACPSGTDLRPVSGGCISTTNGGRLVASYAYEWNSTNRVDNNECFRKTSGNNDISGWTCKYHNNASTSITPSAYVLCCN